MLYKYILEIKNRVFLIIISWMISILICYCYKETLLFLILKLNDKLYYLDSFYFITTNLTDVFNVYLQITCFISNQFMVILIIYHGLVFFSPGLFKHEYYVLKHIILISLFFYCIGIFVCNYLVLPHVWSFFLSFQNNQLKDGIVIFFEAQITEYFNFYISIYYISVFISQIFVLVFLVLNFVKNKIKFINNTRKLAYSSFLIFSTVITPPDIISQITTTLLFVFIYEIIIGIVILNMSILKTNKI